MKTYILLALLSINVRAIANTPPPDFKKYLLEDFCDACGCSASGGGMGFSSMIDKNFVGLRYLSQSYSSRDGIFNDSPWIDENFNTLQLWAKVPIYNKLQLSVQVPYHFHDRDLSSGNQSIDGLGDVTVIALYTLYQTQNDSLTVKHTLQGGVGIKAPTGKYDGENNGSVNPSFQLGTGSWDYLLAAEYTIARKNLGLNAMASYIIKTENDQQYRFGNQFNYSGTMFYMVEKERFAIVPQVGIAGEIYAANKQNGEEVPDTEGNILFGKAGFEAGSGRFSMGINAMLPLKQDLTGGRVEANYRWSVNLNYSL